jgi:hypothetical protein
MELTTGEQIAISRRKKTAVKRQALALNSKSVCSLLHEAAI